MTGVRIAVVGAGLIGRRHIEVVAGCERTSLAAVVEPGPAGQEMSQAFDVPLYPSLAELLATDKPEGVILATPNQMHVAGGLECVRAGVPVLVEKPIGHDVPSAARLVLAGERAGVPVLTGHHRQHSAIMSKAREVVQSGALGTIVAVSGTALFYKPDSYFDVGDGWRRSSGGGPILLNLIHDVGSLQALVGDIVSVQAVTSSATRGFAVEDTAGIVMTFANGALGTFLVSDTAASPRSWEQTSREDTRFPAYDDEDAYHLAGTAGSLSIPTMRLKTYAGERSWWEAFESSQVTVQRRDPLADQVDHFAAVIRGETQPLVTGRDGLKNLRVVDAVVSAARTGRPVHLPPL